MVAFYRANVSQFLATAPESISGQLSEAVLRTFPGGQAQQLAAWKRQVELLQESLSSVCQHHAHASNWFVLFEFPLLRLQRRLDVVVLAGSVVVVIEFKVGAEAYQSADIGQVEEYAADLRDFHALSQQAPILPVLCATEAPKASIELGFLSKGVSGTIRCNAKTLVDLFEKLALVLQSPQIDGEDWNHAAYKPVPTIIEAAQLLFAGHSVGEIADASSDPKNLTEVTERIIELIGEARRNGERKLIFVTGIPGSGKTLVGLNAIHDPRFFGELLGRGAFLSGNTPLVTVLRGALARDQARRTNKSLKASRADVRTKVQGLMQFLQHYLEANGSEPPDEHVVIFDEAQRAWDEEYGSKKFNRKASEPALFLEIMERRPDWAVIVALVGGGQEINKGERGLKEWGAALTKRSSSNSDRPWRVVSAPQALEGGNATTWQTIFEGDPPFWAGADAKLHLGATVRSHRCLELNDWVQTLLTGDTMAAGAIAKNSDEFPVYGTRSLFDVRHWLKGQAIGNRKIGLVASSGARRLRAEGLGVSLSATELADVENWYLCKDGDIRSSNALEVTANEYTCQGLELDYVGLCWDGDMIWDSSSASWVQRQFMGNKWKTVANTDMIRWITNKYRVLLTRSRGGMVIWVPWGDACDETREPKRYDAIWNVLVSAGIRLLPSRVG